MFFRDFNPFNSILLGLSQRKVSHFDSLTVFLFFVSNFVKLYTLYQVVLVGI